LAEAGRELGGRVTQGSQLPGLSEWARIRDYRVQQIQALANVEIFRESELGAEDVLEVGADHVVIATGATWRRDGFGRCHPAGLADLGPADRIFTPDDVMAGRLPQGKVLLFDDDYYYMGAVITARLRSEGIPVTYVTPLDKVAAWSAYTAEQARTQRQLMELGVEIVTAHDLSRLDDREVLLNCVYTGRERSDGADSIVLVTARQPNDALYRALSERLAAGAEGMPKSMRRIGDCEAPAIVAAAVYAGHRYARELDPSGCDPVSAPRDRVFCSST
jgi:dimethylamine/trimethylamine dehydrogenase